MEKIKWFLLGVLLTLLYLDDDDDGDVDIPKDAVGFVGPSSVEDE